MWTCFILIPSASLFKHRNVNQKIINQTKKNNNNNKKELAGWETVSSLGQRFQARKVGLKQGGFNPLLLKRNHTGPHIHPLTAATKQRQRAPYNLKKGWL